MILTIPLLRVAESRLSGTVLRYLLRQAILASAKEGRRLTRVIDVVDQHELPLALDEAGFTRGDNDWVKIGLQVALPSDELDRELQTLEDGVPSLQRILLATRQALSAAVQSQDPVALIDVERRLWPAKILDANVPTYLVPIKPQWAQHLFDEDMANQTLWGAREDLALGNENVYYRNHRSAWKIVSPARILWYVTSERRYASSMCIRACSVLDEVVIGRAKDLFRRFRRLGIFEWSDILRTAKGNADNPIMALRFSNTEILPQKLELEVFRRVLQDGEGKPPLLQSPQPIKPSSFATLYRMAIRRDGEVL